MKQFLLLIRAVVMIGISACWVCSTLAQSEENTTAQSLEMERLNRRMPPAMPIDSDRVADAGVFVNRGVHINLYSDLDDETKREEWVDLFDAATIQWCALFDIDSQSAQRWKLTAVIMQNETRIGNAGLIPQDLPKFPAGYNRGHEFWVYIQTDDYYTRHLILHEGTHAFMQWFLGSSGPPWYSEGMAEWIALHQWDDQGLKLNHTITDKSLTPGWGRVNLLKKMLAQTPPKSLDDIFETPPTAFRDVNAYAWSWAACEFLANHPLSEQIFAKLPTRLNQPILSFSPRLRSKLEPDWDELTGDWYRYIHEVNYGTDVSAAMLKTARKTPDGSFEISATSSWQSTGISVISGDRYRIVGEGQFVVGQTIKPWRCESGGVTVEYYDGHPLGKLIAAVITGGPDKIHQIPIGSTQTPIVFNQDGILALRINESPARLNDNSGHLKVTIEKIK